MIQEIHCKNVDMHRLFKHTGEWYLAHLTGRPIHPDDDSIFQQRGYCPLGRETAIQKLYWKDEWPYVVGGKEGSLEVEAPSIPEKNVSSNVPGS